MSHGLIRQWIKDGPYTVHSTSGMQRVESEKWPFRLLFHYEDTMDRGMPAWIGIIRAHVKSQLKKGLVKTVEAEADHLHASDATGVDRGEWADCYELDLTAAWFTSAREIGAVSKKIYRMVMAKCSKAVRLRLIGGLGTVKKVQTYDGEGVPVGRPVACYSCPETVPVLRSIRAHTDNLMRRLKMEAGGAFKMYFADAIFIKKSDAVAKRLQRLAERRGFALKRASKVYSIGYAPINGQPAARAVPTVKHKRSGEVRPFCVVDKARAK